jgi:hypothetical protein
VHSSNHKKRNLVNQSSTPLSLLPVAFVVDSLQQKMSMAGHHFPGDPRFGTALHPSPDDVKALRHREFLSTRLLDCLIQRAAPPQEPSSDNIVYLGSLGAMHYIQSSNSLISPHDEKTESAAERKRKQAKVMKIRSVFLTLTMNQQSNSSSQLLIRRISLCLLWTSHTVSKTFLLKSNTMIPCDAQQDGSILQLLLLT